MMDPAKPDDPDEGGGVKPPAEPAAPTGGVVTPPAPEPVKEPVAPAEPVHSPALSC